MLFLFGNSEMFLCRFYSEMVFENEIATYNNHAAQCHVFSIFLQDKVSTPDRSHRKSNWFPNWPKHQKVKVEDKDIKREI